MMLVLQHVKRLSCCNLRVFAVQMHCMIQFFVIHISQYQFQLQKPAYDVSYGKNYRFRVVGAMDQTVFRISIADHKLHVIATDGYLVKPFETDILHVHVGERYDFVVKTHARGKLAGNIFPIRIDSVDVYCDEQTKPLRTGFAYLKYPTLTSGDSIPVTTTCKTNCKALNCPFSSYPKATGLNHYECSDVTKLQLLVTSSIDEMPSTSQPASTKFLNFHFHHVARINDVRFDFSTKPLLMSGTGEIAGQCDYSSTSPETRGPGQCDTPCTHTVNIDKSFKSKTVEFVFSSLMRRGDKFPDKHITKLITHPIHLHGHSFWVKKIVYPNYNENGSVKNEPSGGIDVPLYGFPSWKPASEPIPPVTSTTVRKDVIIVPAGGYVVVAFKVHNPGFWFLHCHIDHHLLDGMAIVLAEMPECIQPTNKFKDLYSQPKEFCVTVEDFNEQLTSMTTTCPPTAETHVKSLRRELLEDELKVIEDSSNFNQEDNDEPADHKPNQSLYYEAEQQQPRSALREFLKKLGGLSDA